MNKLPKYWIGERITVLKENQVFVFGSNPKGRHGAGAANDALKYFGAKYGKGRGLQGQSYALVTKNLDENYYERSTGITYQKTGYGSVTKEQIKENIKELYSVAKENPEREFLISYVDEAKKSLNGYSKREIIDLFFEVGEVPNNILFNISTIKRIMKEGFPNKMSEEISEENQNNYENKYSMNALLSRNLKMEDLTCFWHSDSPFSQWHPSLFEVKGVKFISAEQWMMYCKAKLFNDHFVADEIIAVNKLQYIEYNQDGSEKSRKDSVSKMYYEGRITTEQILKNYQYKKEWDGIQKTIKSYGRKVKGYSEEKWLEKRVPYVSKGSFEKYSQNEHLKEFLLNTEGTRLVECNPFDKIWACGLKKDDPRVLNPIQWQGLDLLGEILTRLREKFIYDIKNELKKNDKKKYKP